MSDYERFVVVDAQVELYKNLVLDSIEAFFRNADEKRKDFLRSAIGSVDFAKVEALADLLNQQEKVINEALKGE